MKTKDPYAHRKHRVKYQRPKPELKPVFEPIEGPAEPIKTGYLTGKAKYIKRGTRNRPLGC